MILLFKTVLPPMKKLITALCMMAATASNGQTLFTYGKEAVSADDFVRAFQKNNTAKGEKALKEYLDLYIASRLKIKQAKEEGLDTLPQMQSDLTNLRQQILPTYLNDKESVNALVKEAFTRSQKDIRLAHIFIAFDKNGRTDVEAAAKRRDEVVNLLAKGGKFEDVARQYSDDPSVISNGGDLGWVTVFSLPYELENLAYTTTVGKTSAAYASKAGYHIIKNGGERKALGRMRAAQILLAFPPGASEAYKASLKKTADSLHKRLLAGDDFTKLATQFSNDVISAAANGQMAEFGVGEYSTEFETAAFGLVKDGAFTKPFATTHGYHIVKRLKYYSPLAKPDADATASLQQKVESSDRIQNTRKVLAEKIIKTAGFQQMLAVESELWAFSDSVLNNTKPVAPTRIATSTSLLKIGDQTKKANDWISFAQLNRYKANGTGAKSYKQIWDEFVQASALQYYEDHLEDYNEDFRRQINEFAEGNLFFEIMQRNVWTPAQSDTVALLAFYQKNKGQYVWKQSADAVVFYATDAKIADEVYKSLRKNPTAWKTIAANYSEQVTTDSARFEITQLPKGQKDQVAKGAITTPAANTADNTTSFAYIINIYNKEEPRNFQDAKGLVINDYQAELEKTWVEELKKKYPVVVDEKVWNDLMKKLK